MLEFTQYKVTAQLKRATKVDDTMSYDWNHDVDFHVNTLAMSEAACAKLMGAILAAFSGNLVTLENIVCSVTEHTWKTKAEVEAEKVEKEEVDNAT